MRILIIGGGIGGLTAAIALRRAGLDTTVFERAAELREIGAGITLWANAIKALGQLGLAGEIMALGMPELQGSIRSAGGQVLARLDNAALREQFGAPSVALHRADLQSTLLGALGREHVQLGRQLVRFEQDVAGVTAHFADGSSARGDALVGADGLHSSVRAQLHGHRPPIYAGYTAWRAVVPFDHARLAAGESWGRGVRFGQVALARGQVYWFAAKNTPPGERSPDGEKAALLALFRGWHAPIEQLIAAADEAQILRNDIFDRPPLEHWGAGRVTLLGDAAHPMTPNLGQGACQAIEDALVLAKMLRGQLNPLYALREYESRRIGRTAWLVAQSRRVGAVGQWQGPLAVRLRELAARYLLPAVQSRQLRAILSHEV